MIQPGDLKENLKLKLLTRYIAILIKYLSQFCVLVLYVNILSIFNELIDIIPMLYIKVKIKQMVVLYLLKSDKAWKMNV